MTHKDNVQRWYALLNAKWYDPFRKIWTKLASEKAEKEFVKRLKKKITPQTMILELGCGTGINVRRIKDLKFKSYTGLDLSSSMLRIAKKNFGKVKNVSFVRKDIAKPLNKKYDLIISTWVLSLIEEPAKLISLHYKNLSKKGTMFLIFLTKPKWYIHFWFYPLIRFFAGKYVSEEEIRKMPGTKRISRYALGMTTLVEVQK